MPHVRLQKLRLPTRNPNALDSTLRCLHFCMKPATRGSKNARSVRQPGTLMPELCVHWKLPAKTED